MSGEKKDLKGIQKWCILKIQKGQVNKKKSKLITNPFCVPFRISDKNINETIRRNRYEEVCMRHLWLYL